MEGDPLQDDAGAFIAESARLGTWVWDRPSGRVRWNRKHEELLGYEVGTPERHYERPACPATCSGRPITRCTW